MPGNYTVNKSGKRFANESQNYLTFMLEVLKKQEQGESFTPMYMIFDSNHRKLSRRTTYARQVFSRSSSKVRS